jgi:hypothetical protein
LLFPQFCFYPQIPGIAHNSLFLTQSLPFPQFCSLP